MRRFVLAAILSVPLGLVLAVVGLGDEFIGMESLGEGASEFGPAPLWYLVEGTGGCGPDRCGAAFWFAGSDVTFLKGDVLNGGNIRLSIDDSDTPGTDLSVVGGRGLPDETGFASRVWIGRQLNENWAVAGRFWHLSDSVEQEPAPAPGSVTLPNFLNLSETSWARIYTVDVEGIRSFRLGRCKFDGSVGTRYASFDADSDLLAFGVFTSGNFEQLSLDTFSGFDGVGVTYALAGRRPIGNTPLHLFVQCRGSNIYGTADHRARVSGTVASAPSSPLVGAATVRRNDYETSASIAEVQVGLECEFPLAYVPASVFIRTAWEYQYWSIHRRPAGGAGFGGTLNDITVNSFASNSQDPVGATLNGLVLGTGLVW